MSSRPAGSMNVARLTTMARSRERVLFIAECVTLAHMARPAVLAQGIGEGRYDIVFAADRRYHSLFPDLPGSREELFSISSERFMDALAKGKPVYDQAVLTRYVEDDLALIERVKPDLIVGDFRLSLSVSARLCKVPYIALSNLYWSPYAVQHYPVPHLPVTRLLGVAVAQKVFDLVRPIAFSLHTIPLNRVRRRFGLESLGNQLSRTYTDADLTLYADLPDLIPTRPMPSHHRRIGPILWAPDVPLPAWWSAVDQSVPLVYLTPGSSGDVAVLSMIVKALADLPITLMIATAGRWQPEHPRNNVFCAEFLPGLAAARRASMVICNGGSPTTYQALAAGTPVIGIPCNLDQYLNMGGIQSAGAGVALRSDRLNAKDLRSTVRALLDDPGYRKQAASLKRRIQAMPAERLFAEAVAKLI